MGPVVQSIGSLTRLLVYFLVKFGVKDLLSHLKYIQSSVLIFLLKKCELLHSTAKAPHIFQQKMTVLLH